VAADERYQGLTRWFGFGYEYDPATKTLKAALRGVSANKRTKALLEGKAAGQAFLNQGSDLLAGEGIANAVFAAANAGPSVFSAFSYGHSRYDTGSHVDVDGFTMLVGAAFGTDVSFGRITFGAFFELGDGSYDSYNDFGTYSVDGTGDVKYAGGGLLARFDLAKSESGSTYIDVTARAGRASTDFSSDNLWIRRVTYDVSSSYFGFSLGAGRIFNLTDSTSLDLYGKWIYSRQSGDSAVIDGAPVNFDDITSHRLRAGARVSTAITDIVKPYFGAAYEHEFDGKAGGSSYGLRFEAPDLKGGTGIGELGLAIQPTDGLTVDIGLQGYVGVRQGVSGSLRFTYNF
jgi:hypothetical protein